MKKTIAALVIASMGVSSVAFAQTAPAAPAQAQGPTVGAGGTGGGVGGAIGGGLGAGAAGGIIAGLIVLGAALGGGSSGTTTTPNQ